MCHEVVAVVASKQASSRGERKRFEQIWEYKLVQRGANSIKSGMQIILAELSKCRPSSSPKSRLT
eukprot:664009-Pelagomonas_calceolata.AAC.3